MRKHAMKSTLIESESWSLRLVLAIAVATALWVGAIALTHRVVAGRAGNLPTDAIARSTVPAGSHARL
jgi:hypothetical protein